MRAHRVRFTRPRVREELSRATKTREGITVIRRNAQGRQLKSDMIADQYRKQHGFCAKCDGQLELVDAVFESKEFRESVENRLVHRKGVKCESVTASAIASSQ